MKEELYSNPKEEYDFIERYLGMSPKTLILSLGIVLLFGIYLGILLFGDNSLEVLMDLEEYELYLEGEIKTLKSENANLQKEYFELMELDPDNK